MTCCLWLILNPIRYFEWCHLLILIAWTRKDHGRYKTGAKICVYLAENVVWVSDSARMMQRWRFNSIPITCVIIILKPNKPMTQEIHTRQRKASAQEGKLSIPVCPNASFTFWWPQQPLMFDKSQHFFKHPSKRRNHRPPLLNGTSENHHSERKKRTPRAELLISSNHENDHQDDERPFTKYQQSSPPRRRLSSLTQEW